jgi:excisionase family DNA binding protein
MARRPNAHNKVTREDRTSGIEGRTPKRQAQIIRTPRNCAGNRSAPGKKKRRNRVEELAVRLNLPRSSVYLYLSEGWIPCAWIRNRWLIPDDVEDKLKTRAYENWRAPNMELQQRRKEGWDSKNDSVKAPLRGRSPGVATSAGAKRRETGDVWLSPRQFARRFGVGTGVVYGAVERGELPAIRLGRHIRIPPDAVEDVLSPITVDN